jgi:hypothetical protein
MIAMNNAQHIKQANRSLPQPSVNLRSLWLVLVVTGCSNSIPAEPEVIRVPQEIVTREQLETATVSSAAVMHVDVDWSVTAVESRGPIERLREAILQEERLQHVAFYRFDCTDQQQDRALCDWLDEQHLLGRGPKRFHGNGALAWLKEGQIVDYVDCAARHTDEELWERTKAVFLPDESMRR